MKAKKILAALIGASMALGMVSVPAFAEGTSVSTAEELVAAVANTEVSEITLKNNISMGSSKVEVKRDLTINGGGHTISSTANRILWCDESNITLTMNNITFDGNNVSERGIQINTGKTGVKWVFDNVTVKNITYYALNICGNVVCDLDIKNSSITATWAAFNMYGKNSTANFTNCILSGDNTKPVSGWNDFGTFVLEGDTTANTDPGEGNYAHDVTCTLTDCTIVANSASENCQYPILFNKWSRNNVIYLEGNTKFECVGNVPVLVASGSSFENTVEDNSTTSSVKENGEYVAGEFTEDVQNEISKNSWIFKEDGDVNYVVVPADTNVGLTKGTAKTAIDNGVYDQITVDEGQVQSTEQLKITYTVTINGTSHTLAPYTYDGNYSNVSLVYGLIVTDIPESDTVVISAVVE